MEKAAKKAAIRKLYIKQKNIKANKPNVVKKATRKLLLSIPRNEAYHASALSAVKSIRRSNLIDIAITEDPYGIWALSGIPIDLEGALSTSNRIKITLPEFTEEQYQQLEQMMQASYDAQIKKSLMNEDKQIHVDFPSLDVTTATHLLLWKDIVGNSPPYDVFKEALPVWPVIKKKCKLPTNDYFVTYGTLPLALEGALEKYSDRRISPSSLDELINVCQYSRCTRVIIPTDNPAITAMIGTGILPLPVLTGSSRYIPRATGLHVLNVEANAKPEDVELFLEKLKL
ncbi:MAG: hypothetical protein EOM67_14030 [Spirochaetia bacterium]|nr:hypothetical protein [Spirochaetia bacterium]